MKVKSWTTTTTEPPELAVADRIASHAGLARAACQPVGVGLVVEEFQRVVGTSAAVDRLPAAAVEGDVKRCSGRSACGGSSRG